MSLDGREAACEADAVTVERTERFLFAQVLPLAAVLQGLDVMHASAVAWDGGVVAFVGRREPARRRWRPGSWLAGPR